MRVRGLSGPRGRRHARLPAGRGRTASRGHAVLPAIFARRSCVYTWQVVVLLHRKSENGSASDPTACCETATASTSTAEASIVETLSAAVPSFSVDLPDLPRRSAAAELGQPCNYQ
jgi:hypothetical protein